ncbi:hypothetical protein OF855_24565 [Mycolicibacterium fortuitum]|uniref:hypothetical protein n=1 Tax=Mycolicibacterium fortuitum TaxID=1766 RepID=UPI0022BA5E56|nr:hypothetical protein [Mycolicibacterium fortuitum]WAY18414.1 hypothetical protein OF855_24565 [Mycolicibacterium fortuitum]
MSNERRQYVLDTDDARFTFTGRQVINAAGNGQIDVSFVEVQDFRRIPRPQPEIESGDNE